ncbi:hypothetical protein Leryth_017010 [Lithospermum erythrorhizon]|nr:hypothetical protein Leryth_017010 [Lithospermum erythrorhizon]
MQHVESALLQLDRRTQRLTAKHTVHSLYLETLYQSTVEGKKMVDVLIDQGIVPGIKVDKGLVPLAGSNNESWCQGLDGQRIGPNCGTRDLARR